MRQAVIDQLFTGLGRPNLPQSMPQALFQGLPQQEAFSVQGDKEYVTQRAEKFLKDNIIEGGTNRWLLRESVGHNEPKVNGDQIQVSFNVLYGRFGQSHGTCQVNFIFQGKNTGGVKQYDLVGAGLHNWEGATPIGAQFEAVAKELFKSKVGTIDCNRFDQNTFANNVVRQAEKMYGAKEGTYVFNKAERIDGGIRILMYTDNNPFNPKSHWKEGADTPGRGELWLTFKYDDAKLSKGFLTLSEIRQGYHYQQPHIDHGPFGESVTFSPAWQDTGDANVQARMQGAKWWTGVDHDAAADAAATAVSERAGRQFGENVLQWFSWQGRWNRDIRFETGPIIGKVESINASPNGVSVTLWLQRDGHFKADTGINPTLGMRVTFDLKYEGQVNGQHQYNLVDLKPVDCTDWKGHDRGAVDLSAFATTANELKAAFAQVRV
jgi:hypothetical protein